VHCLKSVVGYGAVLKALKDLEEPQSAFWQAHLDIHGRQVRGRLDLRVMLIMVCMAQEGQWPVLPHINACNQLVVFRLFSGLLLEGEDVWQ
jgi:hypothetical protein